MKKYILLLSTLCLGLASCVKDEMTRQDGMVTFKAVYDQAPAVRTVLQDLKPHWTPSEAISVYDGENNLFVNSGTELSAVASFHGKLAGKGRKYYLAACPYDPELSFAFLSKSVYGLKVPAEQTAVENTYDPAAAPSVAYTEDFTLSFRNVCSLVKFRIISDGVESVTIRGNAGEVIAGRFNAAWGESPRITVTAGEDEVTLKGEFKKDAVYYISTVPAVLAEGMSVTLNGSVETFKATYQIDLARSGMVNLGDLSLDPSESQTPDDPADDAVPCAWGLPGEHNTWSTDAPTPMYEVGSNFVAFDVPAEAAAGFKFRNGDTWIGTNSAVSLDTWITAQGEGGQNITFQAAEGTAYDIYLSNTLTAFYITIAGSPAPEPLPEPFSGMAVAGTFNGWSTSANPASVEGDYYVLKGFKAAMVNSADATGGDKGFKFVSTATDGTQTWYGASSSVVSVSVWCNANADGGAPNVYVSGDADAEYDVYLTKDGGKFCVVPAGGSVPSDGDTQQPGTTVPDTGTEGDDSITACRLIVKVNKSIDWYDKYLYTWENGSPTLGAWPGTKLNWDKEDGDYYVYYYDLDKSWNGKLINYIISGGSGQTQDLTVTLTGAETVVTIETSHLK